MFPIVPDVPLEPKETTNCRMIEYGVPKPFPSVGADLFENDDIAIFSKTGTAYISVDASINEAIYGIFRRPERELPFKTLQRHWR
jgi:hypothetical protein